MDVFAHGLWAGAAYKAANKKIQRAGHRSPNVWWGAFWGIFPDLFAFAIPFVWLWWEILSGHLSFANLPRPEAMEPAPSDTLPMFRLASALYSVSHSLLVFFLVFGALWLVRRRPTWELGGWLVHILIDIPTHTYRFFPTPFLWPVSSWTFNGLSWAAPWFLVLNYSLIAVAYLLLRKRPLAQAAPPR